MKPNEARWRSSRRVLWALVGVPLVLGAGLGGSSQAGEPSPDPNGVLYQRYCASCHGVSADGNGVRASHLDPRPADLRQLPRKYSSSVLRSKYLAFVLDDRHSGRKRICGERVLAKLPQSPSLVFLRRGTVMAVLDYIDRLKPVDRETTNGAGRLRSGRGLLPVQSVHRAPLSYPL